MKRKEQIDNWDSGEGKTIERSTLLEKTIEIIVGD